MGILKVDTEANGGAVRLSLEGELDISSVGRVEDVLQRVEAERPQLLMLDLRGLTFMDSTGLRLVVRADERARGDERRLAIVRGPEPVQRVFEIVGLDGRLDMIDEPPA